MPRQHTPSPRTALLAAALALAPWCTSTAQAQETLEGMLEQGPRHSVLWAVSPESGDLVGQVFALFVLTVAAAEAAIGLAILVVFFRNRGSIAVEDINMMKG